jgi:hypothetical protein
MPVIEIRSIVQSSTANAAFGLHVNLIWIAIIFSWLALFTYIHALLSPGILVPPIKAAAVILGSVMAVAPTWIWAVSSFYYIRNTRY